MRYNTIRFEKTEAYAAGHSYVGAKILIDDQNFLDVITKIELSYDKQAAGDYAYQSAEWLHQQLVGDKVGEVALFTCTCGIDGCESFCAEVYQESNVVIWCNFHNINREHWDYSVLGELHFEKQQYNIEIKKLKTLFQFE